MQQTCWYHDYGFENTCPQADNVELLGEGHGDGDEKHFKIKLDFLGKDSIRYENIVEVDAAVYKNMKRFKAKSADASDKKGEEQLFDAMDAGVRNAWSGIHPCSWP